jgi:hypothetical protein
MQTCTSKHNEAGAIGNIYRQHGLNGSKGTLCYAFTDTLIHISDCVDGKLVSGYVALPLSWCKACNHPESFHVLEIRHISKKKKKKVYVKEHLNWRSRAI